MPRRAAHAQKSQSASGAAAVGCVRSVESETMYVIRIHLCRQEIMLKSCGQNKIIRIMHI